MKKELSHEEKSEIVSDKLFEITGVLLAHLWTVLKWIAALAEGAFVFIYGVCIFFGIFYLAFLVGKMFVLFCASLF